MDVRYGTKKVYILNMVFFDASKVINFVGSLNDKLRKDRLPTFTSFSHQFIDRLI